MLTESIKTIVWVRELWRRGKGGRRRWRGTERERKVKREGGRERKREMITSAGAHLPMGNIIHSGHTIPLTLCPTKGGK